LIDVKAAGDLFVPRRSGIQKETICPYAEKMGNCRVILLPGDHMIYEMKPEACGKLIKEFTDGLPAAW